MEYYDLNPPHTTRPQPTTTDQPPRATTNQPRQVLVLDLDETLIHSHHDGVQRPTVKPGTPPDFILKVAAEDDRRYSTDVG